jgi:ketosteroid isomerase-like protein
MALDRVEIVRLAIKVFNREWQSLGEGATFWAEYVDPDVVWEENEPAFTGLERVYRGHEGLVRWFREVLEPWDLYSVEELDLIEVGDSVVLQIRLQGRGGVSGAEVDMTVCNVFTFRDEKIVRRQLFYERDDALRAAREAG